MAVMGVWAFILCNRHRWDIQQKNKKTWKHIKQIFPEQKTKKSFALHHLSSTRGFHWNLEYVNICANCQFIWSAEVYIWLLVWEFKTLCLWQPCLNKLMHVENWHTDHLQHYLYVDISCKFTLARVFVSHAGITINTFVNDLVFFRVIIQC